MALSATACWGGTRTHRNPLLSFLSSGWSLSRFAERRFSGGLLNDPPRTTRLQAFRACQPHSATHRDACQGLDKEPFCSLSHRERAGVQGNPQCHGLILQTLLPPTKLAADVIGLA